MKDNATESSSTPIVLLTGGTGTFGKDLIRHVLEHHRKARLALLIRASSRTLAQKRILDALGAMDYARVEVFAADLEEPQLGLSAADYQNLAEKVTHVLHAAASTRFNLPLEEIRRYNVDTTRHMLAFAEHCTNLERFGHVSTALVAGKRSGTIYEEDFEHYEGFLNTYQQSKYEAEALVRSHSGTLPIAIFRPPLLISPFKKDGKPTNVLTLSIFLARKKLLPILPGTEDAWFDIMDKDIAAHLIAQLVLKEHLHHMTYHITSGQNTLKVSEIIYTIETYLKKDLNFQFMGSMDTFEDELQRRQRKNPALHLVYNKASTFLPELAYPKVYDNRRVLEELHLVDVNHNAQGTLKIILS